MDATFVRIALRHIGGWLLLIFFVTLLSIIFSFLGTIFCAALAGMMLGAMRRARWALPVSLVFPVVIFLLLRGSKVELSGGQIKMLSVLCFGTFWLVYVIAFALMRFEGKGQGRQPSNAKGSTRCATAAAAVATTSSPCYRISLDTLQGRWLCNGGTAGEHIREKVLVVDKENLRVTVTDDTGRLALRANAKLRLEQGPEVVLSLADSESASDSLVSI